jgi:hypothetical protein
VVTDYSTFAWLCDVFVLEGYRGRRILLATRDAHGLYARYGGFVPLQGAEWWMQRVAQDAQQAPDRARLPD